MPWQTVRKRERSTSESECSSGKPFGWPMSRPSQSRPVRLMRLCTAPDRAAVSPSRHLPDGLLLHRPDTCAIPVDFSRARSSRLTKQAAVSSRTTILPSRCPAARASAREPGSSSRSHKSVDEAREPEAFAPVHGPVRCSRRGDEARRFPPCRTTGGRARMLRGGPWAGPDPVVVHCGSTPTSDPCSAITCPSALSRPTVWPSMMALRADFAGNRESAARVTLLVWRLGQAGYPRLGAVGFSLRLTHGPPTSSGRWASSVRCCLDPSQLMSPCASRTADEGCSATRQSRSESFLIKPPRRA